MSYINTYNSRDITLPPKVSIVKTMVFPVMYRCECWTIKKAEHWRTDAFGLWCWRKLLRAPWTTRRSNQSILKEGNLEYSLEGLMLKFLYFGHLMQRANSLEKTLMLGKIEGRRRRGWQRTRQLDGITDSRDMSLSKLWKMVKDRKAWHAVVHGVAKSWTWLSDWTRGLLRLSIFRANVLSYILEVIKWCNLWSVISSLGSFDWGPALRCS